MPFCTLILSYSCVSLPTQTLLNGILWLSIITRINPEIELFTALNFLLVQVQLKNLL